jgi:amidase
MAETRLRAERCSAAELHLSMVRIAAASRRLSLIWREYDLVVTPTLALLPVHHGWVTSDNNPQEIMRRSAAFSPFAAVANLLGAPAISLPVHFSKSGLPVGAQIMGRPGADSLVLSVARDVEAQVGSWRSWVSR